MNPPYRRTVIEEWNEAPQVPDVCPRPPHEDEPPDAYEGQLGDPLDHDEK